MSTSPGTSDSTGYSSSMAAAPSARLLMWPGVPVTAWATIRPRRSNTALARSPASRTIGLKADRCSARACSFTVEINDCHRISNSTGSNPRPTLMATSHVIDVVDPLQTAQLRQFRRQRAMSRS